MMYWNNAVFAMNTDRTTLNRNIWCIEITKSLVLLLIIWYLNRNIWCIEIEYALHIDSYEKTWTETYDVLKSPGFLSSSSFTILNRNIWCIEIIAFLLFCFFFLSWTETYDVLKSLLSAVVNLEQYPWTETYDVLK